MQVNTTMPEKSLKDSSQKQKIKIKSKPLKTGVCFMVGLFFSYFSYARKIALKL